MEYIDFTIRISKSNEEGKYMVFVDSDIGAFHGTFVNPINKGELNEKLAQHGLAIGSWEDARVRGSEALKDIVPPSSSEVMGVLKAFGAQLFKSLFKDLVLRGFDRASMLEPGLRIRIAPYIRMTEYAEIMSLPWEFLYDDFDTNFITFSRDNIIIVRTPQTPVPINPLVVEPPLKVLAIAANPSDSGLKLEKEMSSLTKIFSDKKIPVDGEFLDKPTIEELASKLRQTDEEYHILHFRGHGTFDESGESALAFEDISGEEDEVTGSRLRSVLSLSRSIKLVFLNACETARIGEADPFAAISTELIQAGVPAVLAMQFLISDEAAIEFSRMFYSRIAEGLPVDQALYDGRKMIRIHRGTENEWGTPVLFMRSTDGKIFKIQQQSRDQLK